MDCHFQEKDTLKSTLELNVAYRSKRNDDNGVNFRIERTIPENSVFSQNVPLSSHVHSLLQSLHFSYISPAVIPPGSVLMQRQFWVLPLFLGPCHCTLFPTVQAVELYAYLQRMYGTESLKIFYLLISRPDFLSQKQFSLAKQVIKAFHEVMH